MNRGYPVSYWNLVSNGIAHVYKMKMILQLLVAAEEELGLLLGGSQHCAPAALKVIKAWAARGRA